MTKMIFKIIDKLRRRIDWANRRKCNVVYKQQ